MGSFTNFKFLLVTLFGSYRLIPADIASQILIRRHLIGDVCSLANASYSQNNEGDIAAKFDLVRSLNLMST
jgi:hypothetical protein